MDFRGLTLRRKYKSSHRPRISRQTSSPAKIAAGDHNGHDNGAPPKLDSLQHQGGGPTGIGSKAKSPNNRTFSGTTIDALSAIRLSSKSNKKSPGAGEKGTAAKELVRKRRDSSARYSQTPRVSSLISLPGVENGDSGAGPVTGELPDGNGPSQPVPVDCGVLAKSGLDANQCSFSSCHSVSNIHSHAYQLTGADISRLLSDATIDSIKQYQIDLRALQERTSSSLQTSSHHNFTHFITISKEAQTLEKELVSLRSLISRVSSTIEHTGGLVKQLPPSVASSPTTSPAIGEPFTETHSIMNSLSSAYASESRRQPNRSSHSGVTNLHTAQMHSLWRTVEGSQKLLPAISGRRVLLEINGWIKLNSATWRPTRDEVRIVLLNDRLLVAVRKRERKPKGWDCVPRYAQGSPRKDKHEGAATFVVEECWPLQDIAVVDVSKEQHKGAKPAPEGVDQSNSESSKDDARTGHLLESRSPRSQDTIDMLVGEKSHSFRPGPRSSVTKDVFLVTYRSALADLIKVQASQTEALRRESEDKRTRTSRPLSAETRKRLLQLKDNINLHMDGMNTTGLSLSVVTGEFAMPVHNGAVDMAQLGLVLAIEGKQESIHWLSSRLDDLDAVIAVQKYEKAVSKIEQLRQMISTVQIRTTPQNAALIDSQDEPATVAAARRLMKQKVDTRAKTLLDMLIGTLTDTRFFRGTIKTRIAWLRRLGFEDMTIEAYLNARTNIIEERSRYVVCLLSA